jgi:amino acid transporter
MTHVLEALIVTSSIACGLALYNTASRYLFSMGREGILPKFLGRSHPTHKTPWNANLAAGAVMLVYAVLFILSDSSTLAQLTKTSTYGALMGVCALLLVQILCSVAIVRYFMTTARDGFHWWKTLVAPVLGGAAIIFAGYSLLKYRADLAGGYPLFVKAIPWVVLASFIIGLVLALYFKSRSPERYEAVGRYVEADVQGELEPVLDTSGKGA